MSGSEGEDPGLGGPGGSPREKVFRGRTLGDGADVYSFNTWDDVPWDAEREAAVEAAIADQLGRACSTRTVGAVMSEAQARWNWFYEHHARWFFKDRNWLPSEFPELFSIRGVADPLAVLEVGCGAGNTVFPLARYHREKGSSVFIHACDVSDKAVQLVREFREYDPSKMSVFQADVSASPLDSVEDGTLDVITCIFVLSALDPDVLCSVLAVLKGKLKRGGMLLVRDYARGDLTQLRLKPDRVVSGEVYTRGDGTAVHFFTGSEFDTLAHAQGLRVVQNYTDRRLIVNRKRQLQMYRCWIQVKLLKE